MFHKGHRELNIVERKPMTVGLWIAGFVLVAAFMLPCAFAAAIVEAFFKLIGE